MRPVFTQIGLSGIIAACFFVLGVCSVVFAHGDHGDHDDGYAFFERGDGAGVLLLGGDENVYVPGMNVLVSDPLGGDAFVLAETLTVDAAVSGDVAVVADFVAINERVSGDVRGAASTLRINSTVSGELLAAASFLDIADDGVIGGRVTAAVDSVVVRGRVYGDTRFYGGIVEIYGQVDGDIFISGADEIILHPGSVVRGDVHYSADDRDALSVADGATVVGAVSFDFAERDEGVSAWSDELYHLVFLIILGLLSFGIFRERWVGYLRGSVGKHAVDVLIGLVALPVASILALCSLAVPGLFIIGVALLLGVCVLLLCGVAASPVIAGRLVESLYTKKLVVSWRSTVIGVGVLFLLSLIPFAGGISLMLCAFFIAGRGIRRACVYLFGNEAS